MTIQNKIQQAVHQGLLENFSSTLPAEDIQVQDTRPEFAGDFTVVVFPLTKVSKKSPQETADILGHYLVKQVDEVIAFEVVKGFLNLTIASTFWVEELKNLSSGNPFWEKTEHPRHIMVEYSSPNTNKPLHLGHIRNNLLGWSVAEILEARGHRVMKSSLVNDRGIHICKSMLAWQKWGNGETPESSGTKGDHLVGKYYVEFDKAYKAQIKELVDTGMKEEEAEKKAPLMLEAQDMLRKWEAGDQETLVLWEKMNGWVYAGFEQTYKALGVDFDRFYYESQTYLLGKEIVKDGLDKGVFFRKADGSVWIDLTDEGLDQKLLLRSDGTSVYITQDLGTARQRFDEYRLDDLIYVVGNEQDYHFQVLRFIFKKLGKTWWSSLYHLSYGMVDLPSGKMKSREGTVVDADDLVAEMIEKAEEKTLELGKIEGFTEEEKKELFRKIGMAALKFFILKVDPKKRMLFNPEESIELQGFTGPFVQYTYSRIRSMITKSGLSPLSSPFPPASAGGSAPSSPVPIISAVSPLTTSFKTDIEIQPEERELLRLLYKRNAILQEAETGHSPAALANYAYELAKAYNKFYQEIRVLNEKDDDLRNFRLSLSSLTAETIRQSLALLGIETPERM